MPLSERRPPADTDAVSAAPKRRAARGKAAPEAGGGKPAAKPSAPTGIADKLAKLGLTRDIDLVLHLPMRYEDETSLTPVGELLPGGVAQTEGVVFDNEIAYRPRRQLLVKLRDDAGDELVLRFLNFYGSQVKQMAPGVRLRVRGDVRGGFFGMEMVHPAVRVVDEDTPLPQALTPVYPSTAGVTQAYLRKAIDSALSRTALPELLPEAVARAYLQPLAVPPLMQAVRTLHHPNADSDETALIDGTHPAWTRIKFEELLAQQMSLKRAHEERRTRAAPAMPRRAAHDPDALVARLLKALPFALTGAQQRVGAEIAHDLTQPHPMQRLLQGDVGSGKTIVAALAAAQAIDAGYQAALMAPTEILAEQHARKLRGWLEPLGVSVAWLAGSLKTKEKRAALQAAALGTRATRDRHARDHSGHGRIRASRARGGRRAAPVRRRAAARAARKGAKRRGRRTRFPAASIDDVGHADSAHARDDVLRGPRRIDHRRTAARPHADPDEAHRGRAPR